MVEEPNHDDDEKNVERKLDELENVYRYECKGGPAKDECLKEWKSENLEEALREFRKMKKVALSLYDLSHPMMNGIRTKLPFVMTNDRGYIKIDDDGWLTTTRYKANAAKFRAVGDKENVLIKFSKQSRANKFTSYYLGVRDYNPFGNQSRLGVYRREDEHWKLEQGHLKRTIFHILSGKETQFVHFNGTLMDLYCSKSKTYSPCTITFEYDSE